MGNTRRSERRALMGVGVRVSPWLLSDESTRVSQCSVEPHKLRTPGATPGPATCGRVRKPWQSGEVESLVILWVRHPPRLLRD